MLILNSIFHKLISIKVSDKVLFEKYSYLSGIKTLQCCKCGQVGQYTMHSPYQRGLIYFSDGKRKDESISIKRVICQCGRTHALLADNLIPFSSYSLRFVITILWKFLNRTKNLQEFCSFYYIAPKTLYKWLELFLSHYREWVNAAEKLSELIPSYINYIQSLENFPISFFKKTGHSFLEDQHQHNCTIESHAP